MCRAGEVLDEGDGQEDGQETGQVQEKADWERHIVEVCSDQSHQSTQRAGVTLQDMNVSETIVLSQEASSHQLVSQCSL